MSRQPENQPKIGVIGGGVAGLVVALSLRDAGFPVHLYEKTERLGEETCSWFAGGMIAPWCERDGADDLVRDRGIEALDWWASHYDVDQKGSLVLSAARDRSEIIRFARRTQEHVTLDETGLDELEPDLCGRFHEGLFYPKESHIDPRAALPVLEKRLLNEGGLVTRGVEVSAEELKEDIIIDCRGFAARHDLSRLRGVRGEMIRIHSDDVRFSRPIRLLHPRQPVYVVPREEDGVLMIGATSIESDCQIPVTVRSAYDMLEAVQRLHPALGEATIIEMSAGIRPAFPDNIPDIEQHGRVIHANGLYRHGFLLSPWCARKVVELIQKEGRAAA